jgi:acyl-CoA thioester hydrolase
VSFGQLIPLSVHWDELDALGMLHNSRYPLRVERAWLGLWQQDGFRPDGSDAFHVVTELRVPYEVPVTGPGSHAVHLWLERLAPPA